MKRNLKILTLLFVGISNFPCYGDDNHEPETKRPIRDLLLLENSVKLSKVKRGEVWMKEELAEELADFSAEELANDKELAEIAASEKLRLIKYPPGEFCCYFSFESDLDLQGFMARCATLKNEKIQKKVCLNDVLIDFWIAPKFPDKALQNTDGVQGAWHRDDRIYLLYLTALPVIGGNGKKHVFYGCCKIKYMPTNGAPPPLGFDKQGKLIPP